MMIINNMETLLWIDFAFELTRAAVFVIFSASVIGALSNKFLRGYLKI